MDDGIQMLYWASEQQHDSIQVLQGNAAIYKDVGEERRIFSETFQ